MYKSIILIVLCLLPFVLAAQSSQSYIDAKCQELASDEARYEAELKRIQREKATLRKTIAELEAKENLKNN
jgi:septal ring factor EnvC (AmiA/AmiB activator)